MIKRKTTLVTLKEAHERFMYYKKTIGLSDASIRAYQITYNAFVRDMKYDEEEFIHINKDDINYYINYLKEHTNKLTSVNSTLGQLTPFFNWCMNNGYIERFEIDKVKVQETVPRFYNNEQLQLLTKKPANGCDYPTYSMWVIVCFILATGARISTVVNVQKEDIDFTKKEVTYRHVKNRRAAIIPLSNSICKIINEYLLEWDFDNKYLFCTIGETQLLTSTIQQRFTKYCKERGVECYGLHALRHTFARQYIKNGGNAFYLQKLMTHSCMESTRHYVNLFSDDLHDNLESLVALDTIIKNPKEHTIKKLRQKPGIFAVIFHLTPFEY